MLDSVAVADAKICRPVAGDEVERPGEVTLREHVADMQAGIENPQQVSFTQRVERVGDGVLPECDVQARVGESSDRATPRGVGTIPQPCS